MNHFTSTVPAYKTIMGILTSDAGKMVLHFPISSKALV